MTTMKMIGSAAAKFAALILGCAALCATTVHAGGFDGKPLMTNDWFDVGFSGVAANTAIAKDSTTGITLGAGSWTAVPTSGEAVVLSGGTLSIDADSDEALTLTPVASSATGMETVAVKIKANVSTSLDAPADSPIAAFALYNDGSSVTPVAYVGGGWTNLVYDNAATLTNGWFTLYIDYADVDNVKSVRFSVQPDGGSVTVLADSNGTTWFTSGSSSATKISSLSFSGSGLCQTISGDCYSNAVAQVNGVNYATFADAIAAANAAGVSTITILDGTTVSPDAGWKVVNGQLVKKVYVAQVVHNDVAGQQYETIQEAIDAASAGDTINVMTSHTVDSEIEVDKAVTISGQSKDGTILTSTINTTASSAFKVTANNVTIENLTINRPASVGDSRPYHVNIGPSATLSNITVQNVKFTGGHYCLNLYASDFTIDSCEFDNPGSDAILLGCSAGDSKIINSEFVQTSPNGQGFIYCTNGRNYSSGTLTISGNVATKGRCLFHFLNWSNIQESNKVTLNIVNNVATNYSNKGIVFASGSGYGLGSLFSSITITNNVLFTSAKRTTIQRDDSDTSLPIDASYNYWGVSNPNFEEIIPESDNKYYIVGNNIVHEPYYQTFNSATGELSDLYPEPDPYAYLGTKVADGFYQNATTYGNSTDFYITSKAGLEFFRDIVNGDVVFYTDFSSGEGKSPFDYSNNIFSGKTVHLLVDVDLNNEEWTPIGYTTANGKKHFYGTFDAGIYDDNEELTGTHTISNLRVVNDSTTEKAFYPGLFGYIVGSSGAALKNITIENAYIRGYSYVGVLVGKYGSSNNLTLDNCHLIGIIDVYGGYRFVGGLTGHAYCIVTNCTVGGTGTIAASAQCVGSMIGYLGAGTIADCTVSNVTISTGTYRIGAIVGDIPPGSHVSGCTVSNVTVTAGNAGSSYTGVVAGYLNDNKGEVAILADNKVYDTTATAAGSLITAEVGTANPNYYVSGDDIVYDGSGKIIGGSFDNVPLSTIATGYVRVLEADGLYRVYPESENPAAAKFVVLSSGIESYYEKFDTALAKVTADNSCRVQLLKNVTLTENLNVRFNCNLVLGEYDITPAGYNLVIATGKTVTTDKQVSAGLFAAADVEHLVTETENGGGTWSYTVPVLASEAAASVTVNDDTTYYLTLNEAFSAAPDGSTVQMLADYTTSSAYSCPITTNSITLDLNGFTFSGSGNFAFKWNSTGTLTLVDTQGGGSIRSTKGSGSYGALYITKGSVIIDGGSVEAVSTGANSNYAVYMTTGSLTVSNGSISSQYNKAIYSTSATAEVAISDGTVNGLIDNGNGSTTVSGGVFDHDPSSYVAEGCRVVANSPSEGYWTVSLPVFVAKIVRNGEEYETLALAIAAAQDGDTIELLCDIQLSRTDTVEINKVGTYTIDGKGFSITPAEDCEYTHTRFRFGMDGNAYTDTKSYIVKDLTISGFDAAAMYFIRAEGCSLAFVDCTVTDNDLSSKSGSRLFVITDADLALYGCEISDNASASYLVDFNTNGSVNGTGGTLVIDNCLFDGNTAGETGIVYSYGSSSGNDVIMNSTFSGNAVASTAASVIYFSGATDVTGCFFTNNTVTASDSTQKCGVLALGSGAAGSAYTGNAFVDNSLNSSGNAATIYVGAENVDLGANYWDDGEAPDVGNGKDLYLGKTAGVVYGSFACSYALNADDYGVTVVLGKMVTFELDGTAPEGASKPSDGAYAVDSALPPATCTDADKSFAGWKVKGSDPAVIVAVVPADAASPIALVATWIGTKTVTVTESETSVSINVTDEWIEKNVTVDEGATPEEVTAAVEEALNKPEANGLPAWQNYVLGQDPNASVAADAAQGAVDAMPVVSTVTPQTVDTGFKVEYRVDEVNADGTPKAGGEGALQDTPALTVDLTELTPEDNVAYYKTVAVITSTDPNKDVTVTVESTNTVGVLMVESGAKTTAIAVPWESLGGGDISVSNIVRTANLTPGDELKAYDKTADKYKGWTLSADKTWEPDLTTTSDSTTLADGADAYTVKRGSAVWLTRKDTSTPIYLVGGVAESKDKVEVTLEAATDGNPSWNLVGSSGTEPVNVETLMGGNTADKVSVPTAYVPKNYEYVDGKGWGYWDSETYLHTNKNGRVSMRVRDVFVTDDNYIPAGTGFWYQNSGDATTIDL